MVAAVVRWYGGTKLGKGGLARAYAGAAKAAVEAVPVGTRLTRERLRLVLPYDAVGALQRLVHPPDLEVVDERYGAEVELVVAVVPERRGEVEALAASLGLGIDLEIEQEGDPPP